MHISFHKILIVLTLFSLNALLAIAGKPSPQPTQYVKPSKTYRYRVTLKDKANNLYSLKHPDRFLSSKAMERRRKFKLKVDTYDLPVSQTYLDYLTSKGLRVICKSKWNNTVVVETSDTLNIRPLHDVSFITNIKRVWTSPDSIAMVEKKDRHKELATPTDTMLPSVYGYAQHQVEMLHVDSLHRAGFTGKGITIAIIDGGFYNADCIKGLSKAHILGTRNFVHPDENVYEAQPHGTMVLSCIAANDQGRLVGTAPDASFYLLMSEDGASENIIEEDYWCSAIEYADSIGADVVTSSLGYYSFDDRTASHKYYELDGRTAVNSRAASLAASRGLVVLNSAGNSGDEEWKKIGTPADASDILTVGAVTEDEHNTVFSSVGNTADNRIKPDVMAMGQDVWLYDLGGNITVANGTSFSTPLTCGAVACLLQAFPQVRPIDIIRAVKQAGNNVDHPDNIYGYGIPDFRKAMQLLQR